MRRHSACFAFVAFVPLILDAQQPAARPAPATPVPMPIVQRIGRIEIVPGSLAMAVGDTVRLRARALDASGVPLNVPVLFVSRSREGVGVTPDGLVTARRGGDYQIMAAVAGDRESRTMLAVKVKYPSLKSVVVSGGSARERLYTRTTTAQTARVMDVAGAERPGVPLSWSSSNAAVASVDAIGTVTAKTPGTVVIRASAGGTVSGERRYTVVTNPVRSVRVQLSEVAVRTGDVVRVRATALDASGAAVADAPITYSVSGTPEDTVIAQFAPAEVDQKGRFVAQKAGTYMITVTSGPVAAHGTLRVSLRDVSQRITLVGRAAIRDKHTSDLYVWTAKDGRDYMIAGMWGAGGQAYFYDVTDPANQILVDSVVVDARTVNDVFVDESGTICVLTREGASNRRNGIVIVDCSNPRDVRILSTFDDGLTGGVHNVFIYKKHVYAVNNGRKFDIINIEDPTKPRRVGVFELETEGHSIHDVWVVDGIAYASQWRDGVILVDVGNGKYGGSPSKPVQFSSYKYASGATHAAYPYRSPTGKFYVIIGDEIFPQGLNTAQGSTPNVAAGYAHIVDFTDPLHPEEVARYEVPEAGSHNFWIEGDKLYAAFYNGGFRVVDISGELKGNLYYQGREIARFMPYDPQGMIANAPFVMGPQLHKGNIFFADWNSGLWTVKLEPRAGLTP